MRQLSTLGAAALAASLGAPAHAVDVIYSNAAGCTLMADGVELIVEGCNLNIRNTSGDTSTADGTGNLVVGHNEASAGQTRSGSHNLVVGGEHEYTTTGGWSPATPTPSPARTRWSWAARRTPPAAPTR